MGGQKPKLITTIINHSCFQDYPVSRTKPVHKSKKYGLKESLETLEEGFAIPPMYASSICFFQTYSKRIAFTRVTA